MEFIEIKIKNIRELKNLTQVYMAKKLGMTQAGYSKLEGGSIALTYPKLVQIAEILEVNVTDILAFDSQKYFSSFNNVRGNNDSSITVTTTENFDVIKSLYEDKVKLLQKLLARTEEELERYKSKFGNV